MIFSFLKANWVEVGSAFGGLISAIAGFFRRFSNQKKSKVEIMMAFTAAHQEIWKEFMKNPQLVRVTTDAVDLEKIPMTPEEEAFVLVILTHFSTTLKAIESRQLDSPEGIIADITQFFNRPIPKAVAQKHFESQPQQVQELLSNVIR